MSLSKSTNAQQALINLTNLTKEKEGSFKGKANLIVQVIFNKIKNNKNKLIFSTLTFSLFFYIYKKYLSSKIDTAMEFYKTIAECKDLFSENNSFDKVLIQYEPCFNNLSKKLLSEIKHKLNSFTNLEDLYNKVKSSKREDMLINWTNLKNKVILFYFTSTVLSRFVILISQSHLLILEKMQIDNQKIPKEICDELLTDLWVLATDYLNGLIEHLDDLIGAQIISIPISSQFSWSSFSKELNNFQEQILDLIIDNFNNEIKLKLFILLIDFSVSFSLCRLSFTSDAEFLLEKLFSWTFGHSVIISANYKLKEKRKKSKMT